MTWHPILRGFSQLGRETRGVRENQFNPLSVCQCLCIAPIELRLISSIHPLPDSPLGNSVKTCAICQPFTTLVIICAPFLINDLHRRLFHHCSRFLAIALRSPLLVVSSNHIFFYIKDGTKFCYSLSDFGIFEGTTWRGDWRKENLYVDPLDSR